MCKKKARNYKQNVINKQNNICTWGVMSKCDPGSDSNFANVKCSSEFKCKKIGKHSPDSGAYII